MSVKKLIFYAKRKLKFDKYAELIRTNQRLREDNLYMKMKL